MEIDLSGRFVPWISDDALCDQGQIQFIEVGESDYCTGMIYTLHAIRFPQSFSAKVVGTQLIHKINIS